MSLLAMLAFLSAEPAAPLSGDVPPAYEKYWALCRNQKGDISVLDEIKGCEALIDGDGIDDEIKAVAHANRGMLMAHTIFKETAKDELDTAIKLNPKLAPAYYNRALLANATGDPEAAVADYSKAISLVPTMAEAYINRGIIYATSGRSELALADFNKAIELEPGSADLYENRGHLLQDMGRSAGAEADFARAKELAKQ
jgi:lipoprotein NlpI